MKFPGQVITQRFSFSSTPVSDFPFLSSENTTPVSNISWGYSLSLFSDKIRRPGMSRLGRRYLYSVFEFSV